VHIVSIHSDKMYCYILVFSTLCQTQTKTIKYLIYNTQYFFKLEGAIYLFMARTHRSW